MYLWLLLSVQMLCEVKSSHMSICRRSGAAFKDGGPPLSSLNSSGFLFMVKFSSQLEKKGLLWPHLHSWPPPGIISHSWHRARGTLKLIGWAWRGYECYDWWSPREIEFLLVVMKKPGGECGRDNVSIKSHTSVHTRTHTRLIYQPHTLICPDILREIPQRGEWSQPKFSQEQILAAPTIFLNSINWKLIFWSLLNEIHLTDCGRCQSGGFPYQVDSPMCLRDT